MLTEELKDKLIEEINLLPEEIEKLSGIWIRLKDYTFQRLAP